MKNTIEHSINNILLGNSSNLNKKDKRLIKRNPYGDYDKDGIINIADCKPYNKNKQGLRSFIKSVYSKATTAVQSQMAKQKAPATPTPTSPATPTPTSPATPKTTGGGGGTSSTGGTYVNPFTGAGVSVAPGGTIPSGYGKTNVFTSTTTKTSGGGGGTSSTGGMSFAPKVTTKIEPTKIEPSPNVVGIPQELNKPFTPLQSKMMGMYSKTAGYTKEKIKQLGIGTVYTTGKKRLGEVYTGAVTTAGAVREYAFDIFKGGKKVYEEQPTYSNLGNINVAYTPGAPPSSFVEKITPAQEEARKMLTLEVGGQLDADIKVKDVVNVEIGKATKKYNNEMSSIEDDYKSGKISYDEAKKENEKIYKEINEELNFNITLKSGKIYKTQTDLTQSQINQRQKDWTEKGKLGVLQKFGIGAVGMASWAIPFGVGTAFQAVDITQMTVEAPSLVSSLTKHPITTTTEIAPYIIGGILSSASISGIKSSIANTQLKAEALAKQRNLKLSTETSVSIGKALRIGIDSMTGETNWEVEFKVLSKIINDKTGKILETAKSVGYSEVKTSSAGAAQKAVVDSLSMDLRKGGVRVYKEGNKLTIKGDLTKGQGIYDVYSPTEGLILARGKVPEIQKGIIKIKALPKEAIIRARMPDISKSSAMVDAMFKRMEKYPEVKIIKGRKVEGIEEIYKGEVWTDVFKNLIDVKGYKRITAQKEFPLKIRQEKVKSYLRKPAKEMKPFRDYGIAYQKVFIPSKVGDISSLIIDTGAAKLKRLKISGRVVAEVSAKEQLEAVSKAFSLERIETIKKAPVKIKEQKVVSMSSVTKALVGGAAITGTKYKTRLIQKEIQPTKIQQISKQSQVYKTQQKYLTKLNNLFGSSSLTRLGERAVEQQQFKVLQQQQQKQYQQQMQKVLNVFAPIAPSVRAVRIPIQPPPKIPTIYKYKKPEYYKVKKPTKAEKKKLKQQKRAYQSSVAAYQLGIYGKPTKRITGLEIRPMSYPNNNKVINLLGGF